MSTEESTDTLFQATYEELKRVAIACFRYERSGITLQPTAVVHETYLRLVRQGNVAWPDRLTFLSYASHVIRQVLTDEARRRDAAKRGGKEHRITLVDGLLTTLGKEPSILDLEAALGRLSLRDERKARIVQLRFYGGLKLEEVATLLDTSLATVNREWRVARAWLGRELSS